MKEETEKAYRDWLHKIIKNNVYYDGKTCQYKEGRSEYIQFLKEEMVKLLAVSKFANAVSEKAGTTNPNKEEEYCYAEKLIETLGIIANMLPEEEKEEEKSPKYSLPRLGDL